MRPPEPARRKKATTRARQAPPRSELWLVDLERCAEALGALDAALPRLLPEERAVAQSIADPLRRRWQTSLRIALRLLLERAAGPAVRGSPILRAAGGKPALASAPVAFNLSDADHLALIAIAREGPIGVDLERVRPLHLAPHRRRAILASGAGLAGAPWPGDAGDRALLAAWCRIEAYAKATGRGLAAALAELDVRNPSPASGAARIHRTALAHARAAGLEIHDVELGLDLVGAVALRAGAALAPLEHLPSDLDGLERVAAPCT
jgi:4'-phosphopantetheinyl transferase